MIRSLPARSSPKRGFSLLEMLVALTISATLLTATLGALNAMFKGYEQTTDSASAHVVTRIAVNRILGMIRTGSDFGPFPADVLNVNDNPLAADYFEYVSDRNDADRVTQVTRIEFRYPAQEALLRTWSPADGPPDPPDGVTGPGDLYIVVIDALTGGRAEYLLLSGVANSTFTLEYDVGPRLMRATIDITIESAQPDDLDVRTGAVPQTVRLVASAMPRRSIIE
jgi:prepilin-type N-terminal cleavage/methylation domain-containing protein